MSALAQHQLAERRLKQFERTILNAATTMGDARPQATADAAVHLARHASLAVAFDPGLLHLLRINFFVDQDRLPYWIEARLLLSTLCRDSDGTGLYVMDAPVRDLLLAQLAQTNGGFERLREVASLLWQYTERRSTWADRHELRHAQQLTALNFLAPERAMAWLDQAERELGSEALPKEWFVAMRRELPTLPSAQHTGDPASVRDALADLDFAAQRAGHIGSLKLPHAKVRVLGGPRDHAQQWLLLRLLDDHPHGLSLAEVYLDTRTSPTLQSRLSVALGLQPTADWSAMRKQAVQLAGSGLAIAIHGSQHLALQDQIVLQSFVTNPLPMWLYAIDDAGGPGGTFGAPTSSRLATADIQVAYLPRIEAMLPNDIEHWLIGRGSEIGVDSQKLSTPSARFELARGIIEHTGGIPQRVLEHLCSQGCVLWSDVLAIEKARFVKPQPIVGEPLLKLAQAYEELRAAMQPGAERTRAMGRVVAQMREVLAPRTDWDLPGWAVSESAGLRLVAVALLESQPQQQFCGWLGTRVREETPFLGYHALLALKSAAARLPVDELGDVGAALREAGDALSPSKDRTDRAEVLRDAEAILTQRRKLVAALPLVPLRGVVLLPRQRLEVEVFRSAGSILEAMQQSGEVIRVFAVRELGEDRVFDAKETKRVGTIAMAYPVRSGGQGERVLLVGQGRAIGHRVDSADSSLLPMCEITALLDVPDGNVTSEDQVELTNALRALSRVDVGRTRFVGALARGSMAQKCYRLADDIDLSASERQSLLQQDDAQQMVRQIVGAVLARVESALPETLGANDRGFARIVAILNRAFASPSDRLLLAAALDVGQPGRNAIEPLVKRYAQAGRLGTVVTHALWRRPDADELWSYVLASGEPADETKPGFRSATPGTSPLKLWPNGSTLHIRFLEAEPKLREAVMRIARQWLQYANLQFVVLDARDKLPGDIRISIDGTNSVWSYVGTDARSIPPAEPTMNLGRLALGGRAAEFQKVVLKQFGVALGLMLEHQNPNGRIEWDRAAVMSTMTGPPNLWSKHVVEANILKRAPQTIPQYRDFDARSVMLYEFEADWLLSKKSLRGGNELSVSDKQFIAELYPGVTRKRPAPAPAHKSTTRALRRA